MIEYCGNLLDVHIRRRKYNYKVGDHVECVYKDSNIIVSGKVSQAHSNGRFDITYDDGELGTMVTVHLL
jgi:hypothetical protein